MYTSLHVGERAFACSCSVIMSFCAVCMDWQEQMVSFKCTWEDGWAARRHLVSSYRNSLAKSCLIIKFGLLNNFWLVNCGKFKCTCYTGHWHMIVDVKTRNSSPRRTSLLPLVWNTAKPTKGSHKQHRPQTNLGFHWERSHRLSSFRWQSKESQGIQKCSIPAFPGHPSDTGNHHKSESAHALHPYTVFA